MKILKCMPVLVLCVCLCGCNLLTRGSYTHVEEHQIPSTAPGNQNVSAQNYQQLYTALANMVSVGEDQKIIFVKQYDKQQLEEDLRKVTVALCEEDPIAAYAVKEIQCTVGTVSGEDAVSVQVVYLRDQAQIHQIVQVEDNLAAQDAICQSLNACDTGVVLYIEHYESVDFAQIVKDHALAYPEYVMEQPQVSVNIYPESGDSRVVEIKFSYVTGRDALKNMQNQVSPVFRSAVLYVSGDAAAEEKYSQLYSFLMERYDYSIETSITPAYSLLRLGAGDCRAFAMVYAAMCRQAGLECLVVSGNRAGENWYWNIVNMDGFYYHVDLLSVTDGGVFAGHDDAQMQLEGYLWNFEAYPVCQQPPSQENPDPDPNPDPNPDPEPEPDMENTPEEN